MFPRNYCPIYLYIPIWLYSNFNISLVHFGNFIFFTFQSGSIQIVEQLQHEYASGILYIPILVLFKCNLRSVCDGNYKLYIPIWFYSNNTYSISGVLSWLLYIPIWFYSNHSYSAKSYLSKSFTFQSGSIQIWTYSSREGYTIELYIPIWFYSNYSLACAVIYAANFTFQSGSIQMINPWTVIFKYIGFTFQSGSIQI